MPYGTVRYEMPLKMVAFSSFVAQINIDKQAMKAVK